MEVWQPREPRLCHAVPGLRRLHAGEPEPDGPCTGVTNDLVRRTAEHRERLDPDGFAERYRADRLVYFDAFEDIVAAIRREKRIKGWSRAKKNALVNRANPDWDDLWSTISG